MPNLPDGNYVVIPDLQAPYHDKRLTARFTEFIRDFQPDGLLCVGDESDSPEPSRWNKGMAGEFAGTLEKGLRDTYDLLHGFARAMNGSKGTPKPFLLSRSNHADRVQTYIARYAPALSQTSWNHYPSIMGYGTAPLLAGRDEPLPIQWHTRPIAFAAGWVVMHGDEGNMIQSAGGTALSLARKTGESVICGHTHRAGIQHWATGHSGRINNTLVGMEVGHMMSVPQAGYLKYGGANWQQAFGILRIRSRRVHPELILVTKSRFVVEGQTYVA